MAMLTIRNIDEGVKERLRVRAAQNGHSMEEEARLILKRATGGITGKELWDLSREMFGEDDGVALELPDRHNDRPPVNFEQ
ncbi:hypothetical protein [Phyllobacterium sp. YR531]|uniref:FitA-like ribbon-helix-helix domain-containing protein n=1 Tax=Phyllobacterium sp. YR531 TaxID=1144343 RepID=UPI00026F522D|nr:hypothetical protein [Phyllobacterium sp. YR531]EJN05613.1 hypothetical protein PMI41_00819 [Phyllobacterium sp. YR531]